MSDMTMSKKMTERNPGEGGRKRAKKYKGTRTHSDKMADFQVGKLDAHGMDSKRSSSQGKTNKADEDFDKMVSNKGTIWPSPKARNKQSEERRYKWGPSGPGRNS